LYSIICDSLGNILIYPHKVDDENGVASVIFYDAYQRKVKNSEMPLEHASTADGMVMVPNPGNPNQIYVFRNKSNDYLYNEEIDVYILDMKIYYSVIELGGVDSPSKIIIEDVLLVDRYLNGGIDATLHANGKDWWIACRSIVDNTTYLYRLTSEGIDAMEPQQKGHFQTDEISISNPRQVKFSPSGKHLVIAADSYVSVMSFNRCSGEIEVKKEIFSPTPPSRNNIKLLNLAECDDINAYIRHYYFTDHTKNIYQHHTMIASHNLNSDQVDTLFFTEDAPEWIDNKYSVGTLGLLLYGNDLIFSVDTMWASDPYDPAFFRPTTSLGIIRSPGSANPIVEPKGIYFGDQYINWHARQNLVNYNLAPLVTAYADPNPYDDSLRVCQGDSVQLGRWGDEANLIYEWQPAVGLSNPSTAFSHGGSGQYHHPHPHSAPSCRPKCRLRYPRQPYGHHHRLCAPGATTL